MTAIQERIGVQKRPLKRVVTTALTVCALSAAILMASSAALAATPTTTTIITTGSGDPYTPDYPCLPPNGTLSDTTRNILHITDFGTGVYHYGETFHGTATFVSAEGKVYSGSVTSHFSINSNKAPNQFTFTIALRYNLVAADGDSLSFTGTVHGNGTPAGRGIDFELNHC
jgi:opacity protein-like surface antigen